MKKFTLTELGNKSGEVTEAAHAGPVDITGRGRRKFVLMTAEHYDRLSGMNKQKVFSVNSMTQEERDLFASALEAVADEVHPNDE